MIKLAPSFFKNNASFLSIVVPFVCNATINPFLEAKAIACFIKGYKVGSQKPEKANKLYLL